MELGSTQGREMCFCQLGKVYLLVFKTTAFPDAVFREYVALAEKSADANNGPSTVSMVYAHYGTLNAAQRAMLDALFARKKWLPPRRTIILTNSFVARNGIKLFGLLSKAGGQITAARPDEFDRGLSWLREVVEFDVDEARAAFHALVALADIPPISPHGSNSR